MIAYDVSASHKLCAGGFSAHSLTVNNPNLSRLVHFFFTFINMGLTREGCQCRGSLCEAAVRDMTGRIVLRVEYTTFGQRALELVRVLSTPLRARLSEFISIRFTF